ncbi:MAG: hypothetical protein Q9227_004406 [Pyrenula ochraceoflavens]
MADFGAYHALGKGMTPGEDPRSRVQGGQQFRSPTAASPSGYQQAGPSFANGTPLQQPPHGENLQTGATSSPGSGYFPPQAMNDGVAGMTARMGSMGVSGESGGSVRAPRRKDRHAYHNLAQPTIPPQPPNAPNQTGIQSQPQFLNAGQPHTPQFPQNLHPQDPSSRFQQPGEEAVTTQGKVDPEQIPSIPRARDVSAQYYLDNVYPTMERHVPPDATVPFVAYDQGNSSPKYSRLTLNNVPSSAEGLASTALPLGLVLQPLAPLQDGEQPIPVLDFGEPGPPRCRRCRTYINPFMTFRAGGNKFVCNMCNFPNDVTAEYFSPTDPSGVRVDRVSRPELMAGTVEFLVPKEYWAKDPVGLRWLFLIDVGQEAVNRGFIETVCSGVREALYGDNSESDNQVNGDAEPAQRLPAGTKVGIVTFDKEVHFYNLSSRLDKAQMMVMTDLEDPFVPLSEGMFVDPYESKEIIMSLLDQLPSFFADIKNPEPALLPTLNAALAALAPTGGKIVCSLSVLPTWGPGRLFKRDTGKTGDTDHERKLLTTEHPGFKKTAASMVSAGIGVDFFVAAAAGGYMDLATIGYIPALTGGEVYFYSNFHAPRDTQKLAKEISHSVNRETGFQALMKVRCSNGLQVSAYHGNFLQHTFGADLEIGTIDADKALAVLFSYDGKLDAKLDAHFQAALLYTTASGQRRVRCLNVVAAVNERGMETMKFIDQDAVVSIIAKEAASKIAERSLKEIRNNITEKTIDILASYRRNYSGSHPPGQMVLPENLKEFSMYMLSLIKSRAFKGGAETSDSRSHAARLLSSVGVQETSLYLYPRVYALHNLDAGDCFAHPDTGHLVVPPTIRASYSRVDEGGAYLVDNGQTIILWLHSQVSPNLLEDLFGEGANSLQSLDPFLSDLPTLQTHLNAQARNLLQYLSTVRGSKATTLQIARQGLDGSEFEFAARLVEDRNNEAQSYVDWLVHVHRGIQMELAGQRPGKEGEGEAGILSGLTNLKTPYWT